MLIKQINSQITVSLFLFCCAHTLNADTGCDDWEAYKDEKCLKIFETLESYDKAVNTCAENNSTLVSIASPEEQTFVVNLLFSTHKIEDNVWIGAKYVNTTYKWVNDLPVVYSNWSEGSPKNRSDYCVEMNSDEPLVGKWSDVSCTRHNIALCQKSPSLTLSQLSDIVIRTRDQLDITNKQIGYFFSNKWINTKTFAENSVRKALIYPHKTQTRVSRSDALDLCKQSDAMLVDIESVEKQKLVESFLYQINPKTEYTYYWIGGYSNSTAKYKWLSSGNEFKYTNWVSGHTGVQNVFARIYSNYSSSDSGKWSDSASNAETNNVFCEITFNF